MFSATHVVQSSGLEEAVFAFGSWWLSQFWLPDSVHADTAFFKSKFENMSKKYDVKIRRVPPNRLQKNMLEPIHGPIIAIYIQLRHEDATTSPSVQYIRAVRISMIFMVLTFSVPLKLRKYNPSSWFEYSTCPSRQTAFGS